MNVLWIPSVAPGAVELDEIAGYIRPVRDSYEYVVHILLLDTPQKRKRFVLGGIEGEAGRKCFGKIFEVAGGAMEECQRFDRI
eukprot:jgi/Pico_ML_1/55805/g1441.t1